MSFRKIVLVAVPALALAGCANQYSPSLGLAGYIDPADFGEANRQTYAAMVIDPDPQYDAPLATSAEHAADAVERYRQDEVKQPVTVRSTGSGSGGSGGGGGGSGGGGGGG